MLFQRTIIFSTFKKCLFGVREINATPTLFGRVNKPNDLLLRLFVGMCC